MINFKETMNTVGKLLKIKLDEMDFAKKSMNEDVKPWMEVNFVHGTINGNMICDITYCAEGKKDFPAGTTTKLVEITVTYEPERDRIQNEYRINGEEVSSDFLMQLSSEDDLPKSIATLYGITCSVYMPD